MRFFLRYFLLFISTFGFTDIYSSNNEDLKKIRVDGINYTITAIEEDSDGVLWLGTWHGLIKYDGQSIETFKPDKNNPKALKGRKIVKIISSKTKNGLWIATRDNGLHFFDKITETFHSYSGNIISNDSINNINTIFIDKFNNLWIGCYNGVYYIPDIDNSNPKIVSVSIKENLEIRSICADIENSIWLGSNDGVFKILLDTSGNPILTQKAIEIDMVISKRYIQNLLIEKIYSDEFLVVVTNQGIIKYKLSKVSDKKQPTFYLKQPVFLSSIFENFSYNANIWQLNNNGSFVSLWENRINKHDATNKVKQLLDINEVNELGEVKTIYQSQNQIIWIGSTNGLHKLQLKSPLFDFYNKELNKIVKNNKCQITSIQQNKNTIYIGTLIDGLITANINEYNILENFQKYPYTKLDINNIKLLFIDSQNRLWITGNKGIVIGSLNSKFEYSKFVPFVDYFSENHYDNEGLFYSICSISELPNKNILLGSYDKGLLLLSDDGKLINRFTSFVNTSFKNQTIPINKILPESNNIIWLGTGGNGFIKMDISKENPIIEIFQMSTDYSNSISDNFINDMIFDKLGSIWIGTENGLNLFDRRSKQFINVMEKDGLPSNCIQGLVVDDYSNVWAGTEDGIAIINPSKILMQNTFLKGIKAYTLDESWFGNFFSTKSLYKLTNGKILFGSAKTLISHTPIGENTQFVPESKLLLKKLYINKKLINTQTEYDSRVILKQSINIQKEIKLEPDDNDFSIEFGVVSFNENEHTKYAYRIVEIDDEWYYTDYSNPRATYTYLPFGVMTLEIKATKSDGSWGESLRQLTIYKSKPFWKTNIAITLYLLCLFGIIYAIQKFVKYQYKIKTIISLEKGKREQIEESFRDKLRFFTNISHELKSPLTLIKGPLQDLISNKIYDEGQKSKLKLAYRNASRLQELVDQILEFRKSEVSSLKLYVEKINLSDFFEVIFNDFFYLAQQKKIELKLIKLDEDLKVWMDADKIKKVLYNLISNAIKFTPSNGIITIEYFLTTILPNHNYSSILNVKVIDNGKGIPNNILSKIFERFYQFDNNSGGFGIGLALSKSLILIHKGKIDVQSIENQETCFNFWIPVGEDDYSTDEKKIYIESTLELSYSKEVKVRFEKKVASETLLEKPNLPYLLLVDDEFEMNSYFKSIFINEFNILQAYSVLEAQELINQKNPDIIISDLMMPDIDGIKFMNALQQSSATKDIPLIMITANSDSEKQKYIIQHGASLYINKPFDPDLFKIQVMSVYNQAFELRKRIKTEIKTEAASKTPKINSFEEKVMAVIAKNIENEKFNVNKLTELMHISRAQLNLNLKKLMGITAVELIRKTRLKHAAKLIQTNEFTISESAYRSGFSDLKYFRNSFKKEFGLTPSDYKKKEKPLKY